jgi:hypothetical protein
VSEEELVLVELRRKEKACPRGKASEECHPIQEIEKSLIVILEWNVYALPNENRVEENRRKDDEGQCNERPRFQPGRKLRRAPAVLCDTRAPRTDKPLPLLRNPGLGCIWNCWQTYADRSSSLAGRLLDLG